MSRLEISSLEKARRLWRAFFNLTIDVVPIELGEGQRRFGSQERIPPARRPSLVHRSKRKRCASEDRRAVVCTVKLKARRGERRARVRRVSASNRGTVESRPPRWPRFPFFPDGAIGRIEEANHDIPATWTARGIRIAIFRYPNERAFLELDRTFAAQGNAEKAAATVGERNFESGLPSVWTGSDDGAGGEALSWLVHASGGICRGMPRAFRARRVGVTQT